MIKNLLNRNLNKYTKIISEINLLENDFKALSDIELKECTFKLRKQYQKDNDLSNILTSSFALTRESSKRNLGLRHFDVQLLGGLVLNEGKIAEMRTGEGKTLVATLPSYLNALTGNGVHVVTVNDYLANRDQNWMGQIHRFLGLKVGLVQENMNNELRKSNYNADITYITNSELGFDYLRDNMATNLNDIVQRNLNYCIVDEVDSILIDEARTPLIISGYEDSNINKYLIASELVKYLIVQQDFEIDDKNKNVIIKENGILQVQKLLKINNLFDPKDPWIPFIINALKANFLFLKNIAYIVKEDQVLIVDQFTGRIMPDRRWSDGLHQSIEAKEGVPIMGGTKTLGSVTYQNFFSLYSKLSGMTGTAKTDEAEFEKMYGLPVIKIPTAKISKRQDLSDFMFGDEFLKWKAVSNECYKIYQTGQPILVGTTSVEKSQILSQLLDDYELPYQILNAKPENVKKESEIIALAGECSSITIATNMAGRGTDIVLGGNPVFKTRKYVYQLLMELKEGFFISNKKYPLKLLKKKDLISIETDFNFLKKDVNFLNLNAVNLLKLLNRINEITKTSSKLEIIIQKIFITIEITIKEDQKQENEKIKNLGGLYIIGTERHESRRIDNQLRGRCGRQGDPGTSRFFLSLDDPLIRNFGSQSLKNYLKNELSDGSFLESRFLTKGINTAQTTLENQNYDVRKNVYDYDEILSKQRSVIFYERRNILKTPIIKRKILGYGDQVINEILKNYKSKNSDQINKICENLFGKSLDLDLFFKINLKVSKNSLKLYLRQQLWLAYEYKEAELQNYDYGLIRQIERVTILKYIDIFWKEHLVTMSLLRDNVGWRGYGQLNPLYEYRVEGYYLFNFLIKLIQRLVIYEFLHIRPI